MGRGKRSNERQTNREKKGEMRRRGKRERNLAVSDSGALYRVKRSIFPQ